MKKNTQHRTYTPTLIKQFQDSFLFALLHHNGFLVAAQSLKGPIHKWSDRCLEV